MRSEALHVLFERFDVVGRVARVAVDERLEPVTLHTQLFNALNLNVTFRVKLECELDMLALDMLLVRKRDADRREV
jgi:hypothetical protein